MSQAMLVGNGLLTFLALLQECLDLITRVCLNQSVCKTTQNLSATYALGNGGWSKGDYEIFSPFRHHLGLSSSRHFNKGF